MKSESKNINVEEFDNYDDMTNVSELIKNDKIKKEYTQALNNIFRSLNSKNTNTKNEFDNSDVEIDEIKSSEERQSFDEVQEKLKTHSQVREAFSNNAKTDRILKIIYGIILLILLVLEIVVVNVIFILGGLGILQYSDITFDIFIGGSLIEVVLIVKIVVKYLFTDNITKPLNSMIDHNHEKNVQHKNLL